MLISRITAPQSIQVSLMCDTTRAAPARHRAAGTRSTPEFVREAQMRELRYALPLYPQDESWTS